MNLNSDSQNNSVASISNETHNHCITYEVDTDVNLENFTDLYPEGNEISTNDDMIEEVVVETVLNELAKRLTDETAISVRDVKDRVCEEMRVSDNSDIASDSSEGD